VQAAVAVLVEDYDWVAALFIILGKDNTTKKKVAFNRR
jgi:hypothetical protein